MLTRLPRQACCSLQLCAGSGASNITIRGLHIPITVALQWNICSAVVVSFVRPTDEDMPCRMCAAACCWSIYSSQALQEGLSCLLLLQTL